MYLLTLKLTHLIYNCDADFNREELQEAQWQAAKANLVPCHNCQRRFDPGRIAVHKRVCRGPKKPPPSSKDAPQDDQEDIPVRGQYRTDFDNYNENSNPNDVTPPRRSGPMVKQRREPKFVFCYICGRQFTDASLPIHEPQCLQKWEIQNSKLPPSQRRPRPEKPQHLTGPATGKMTRYVYFV